MNIQFPTFGAGALPTKPKAKAPNVQFPKSPPPQLSTPAQTAPATNKNDIPFNNVNANMFAAAPSSTSVSSFNPATFASAFLPLAQAQGQNRLQLQREGMMAPQTRHLGMSGEDITDRGGSSLTPQATWDGMFGGQAGRIAREEREFGAGNSVSAPASQGGGVDYGARAASMFAANDNQRSHGMLDNSDEPQVGLTPWMQAVQQPKPQRPDDGAPNEVWDKYHKDYANYFGNVLNARTPAGTIPGAGAPAPDRPYAVPRRRGANPNLQNGAYVPTW